MTDPTPNFRLATRLYGDVKARRAGRGHRTLTIPEIQAVLDARDALSPNGNAPGVPPEAQALIDAALAWYEQPNGESDDEADAVLIDAVRAYSRGACTDG